MVMLESERNALATLDLDRILACAEGKHGLCGVLENVAGQPLDDECRALVDAVQRVNEANRKLRNLIAANAQARLGALTGSVSLYRAPVPASVESRR